MTSTAIVSASPHWDGSTIPRLDGKVAIITGGNSGVGYETAKKLAECGATVILACRSEVRGRKAQQEILAFLKDKESRVSDKQVVFMQIELGNLASIRAFAEEFRQKFTRLDLLINNAGVSVPSQKVTADGLESHFGINHIGHFYLTAQLFPVLQQTPKSRVVNVSSVGHRRAKSPVDFGSLRQGTGGGIADYDRSKLLNLLFTMELHRRLQAKGDDVLSVAAHPGLCHTDIFDKYIRDHFPTFLQWPILKFFSWVMQTPQQGALPILYAGTVESVQSGDYYGPHGWTNRWGYPVKEMPTSLSFDVESGRKLWEMSEEITKTKFDV